MKTTAVSYRKRAKGSPKREMARPASRAGRADWILGCFYFFSSLLAVSFAERYSRLPATVSKVPLPSPLQSHARPG